MKAVNIAGNRLVKVAFMKKHTNKRKFNIVDKTKSSSLVLKVVKSSTQEIKCSTPGSDM